MIDFASINVIRAVWMDDGSSYVYVAPTDSIRGNRQTRSIRFTLREIDGLDGDLEIVIQEKSDGSFSFKTDYYGVPDHEYSLKMFAAQDEAIFHFDRREGIAYFHLSW